jgi:hypothetical protein
MLNYALLPIVFYILPGELVMKDENWKKEPDKRYGFSRTSTRTTRTKHAKIVLVLVLVLENASTASRCKNSSHDLPTSRR